jgi:GAF domain-containing protein
MPEGLNLRLLDVLSSMADQLVTGLDADACAISRVIGDVLILLAERAPEGTTLQSGQGYLVPDFPQTAEVLRTKVPRALTLDDGDVDRSEAGLLEELGFGALLMLPLELNGTVWGLVEVYRIARRSFSDADVAKALRLTQLA